MPDLTPHLCGVEMDSQLTSPFNMKNQIKHTENKSKRPRINKSKSIFSTRQNVLFIAEDKKGKVLNKPPFNFGKMDKDILHAVLDELSISSNPIN